MIKDEYSETLSQFSFWIIVGGSILLGLEGLGSLAEKQLNPLNLLSQQFSFVKTYMYLLIGFAGLHQAYFGYSSFMKLVNFENPWED